MREGSTRGDQDQRLAQPDFFDEPGQDTKTLDIWRYWQIIRNRRWVIIGVFITVSTVMAIKVYRTADIYRATSTIAIEPGRQQVVPGFQGFTSGEQSIFEGRLIQMQLDILQSSGLAERVINKLKLWEYPEFSIPAGTTVEEKEQRRTRLIKRFRSRLDVEEPNDKIWGQRVIPVHYTSTDRHLAAKILKTLIDTFIDYNRERKAEAVEEAAAWLRKELAKLEAKLEKSKDSLLSYQQRTEVLSLGNVEQNPALVRFSTLNGQLAEAESIRINAEILHRLSGEGSFDALPSSLHDPALSALNQERERLQTKLSELESVYQEGASPLQQIEQQLVGLNARIEQAEQSLGERLEKDYLVAKERVDALTEAVEKQREEILRQNRDALEFGLLKREAEVDEKFFQMFSERLREADFMRSLRQGNNVWVVDRAELPLAPSNSNSTTLVIGAFVGLFLGVGLAFVLEFIDDRIRSVDDIEAVINLPNLGVIPLLTANRNGRGWPSSKQPKPLAPLLFQPTDNGNLAFAEAFRTLRTSVLLSSAGRPPRAIAITGNEAGVGKTTVSVNIAVALAQAGKRVLLIDSDMRHPGCALALDVENASGLSTHLASDGQPATIYHDCGVASLDLLPSGPIPPNPSELLSSEKLPALFESMLKLYDHIVIDTAPIGLVSDGLMVSALVDGVILVARSETTSRRGILRVKDSLRGVNARILGVVMNAVDHRRYRDGYYGYGYGYGSQGENTRDELETRGVSRD